MDNNKNLYVTNIITKILTEKSEKQYNTELIEKLSHLNKADNVIRFLFENDININQIIPINYRQIQTIYQKNNNNLNLIKDYLEYIILKKEISKLLRENKKSFIDFLKLSYKNSSRKKGQLFKEVCLYVKKDNKDTFNNLNIITDKNKISDNNFLFLPKKDSDINDILINNNILLKNNKKGRDVLIKYNNHFYIGEAKEIHEGGGSQNHQFNDLVNCTKEKGHNLTGFGILYGACLNYDNKYLKEFQSNKRILTLSDFIFNTNLVFQD